MTIHEDCGVDECDLIWLICFDVLNVVEFRLINGEFDSFTELEQFDDHIIRAFSFDFIEEMHQEFGVIVVVVIVNSGLWVKNKRLRIQKWPPCIRRTSKIL